MSFVSLNLDATTDYAAELEEINFNEFQTMTINLFTENNQTVEFQFEEIDFYMYSDDKVKYIVNLKNAMNDVDYNYEYLDSLNLNECKKGEVVFDNEEGITIKLELNIDYINIEAQIPEDEFGELMKQVAEKNDEVFKALVDK